MDAAKRERPNNLVRQLEKKLTKKGHITKVEPGTNIDGDLRIPSLVAREKHHSPWSAMHGPLWHHLWHSPITRSTHIQSAKTRRQRSSQMDDKQQSSRIPSSEGSRDCNRLQLERSDLIEIVILLERPRP